MKKFALLTMASAICFFVFSSSSPMVSKGKPKKNSSGVVVSNLDKSVKPSVDFYQYACGGWMKLNPMGNEYARYGSFDVLGENNQKQLKDLVMGLAAKKFNQGTVEQKISDFYNLGMDTVTIEKQGADPIREELKAIVELSKDRLPVQLAVMAKQGLYPFFAIFGAADPDNSAMTMAYLWQSGLGIGDRDYYLEANQAKIRKEYVGLISKMLVISGYSRMAGMEGKEDEMANRVLALETCLASATMDRETMRDPYATVNKLELTAIQEMMPTFKLSQYMEVLGVHAETINVGQPLYFQMVGNILQFTDIEVIRAYLAWNVINAAAPYLSKEFVDLDFNFYGKVMSGKLQNSPRWKRVINTVDGSMGEALGQMYVKSYFPAEAKTKMKQLVSNLQWALGQRISESTWMTQETKNKALDKLNNFKVKIGYPDKWRDYDGLNIQKDSYYQNVVRARQFETEYQLSLIGKPVDPERWQMTPQTVNAYYEPSTNEICFPAGILQPPFFDMNADDAVNYGAIGVVIGHEMTHGFDDQGRNYDLNGNLVDWWTKEDAEAFNTRAQVLVDHFDAIEVAPGVHANGTFTLGENIADNGGLNVSYTAFQKAIADGLIGGVMDGFTPDQRFFLAYAGVWAANIRAEEILRRTKEDPHSLGMWRVNGTLPHIEAFYKAFGVNQGDPMWLDPQKRAKIW